MLIPLVSIADDGSVRAGDHTFSSWPPPPPPGTDGAASAQTSTELQRLGLASPLWLQLSASQAAGGPSAAPAAADILRACRGCWVSVGIASAEGVIDSAVKWLDNGSRKVCFDVDAGGDGLPAEAALRAAAEAVSQLPRHRVVLIIKSGDDLVRDAASLAAAVAAVSSVAGVIAIDVAAASSAVSQLEDILPPLEAAAKEAKTSLCLLNASGADATTVGTLNARKKPVFLAAAASIRADAAGEGEGEGGAAVESAHIDVASATIACLKTDRDDGLFTTVVCDEHGVALGLVYSSESSVRACFSDGSGRAIYYSRSRGGLWRKGDTSGAFQLLLSIDWDCDGDALRYTVVQCGDPPAFCHLGYRNCWSFGARDGAEGDGSHPGAGVVGLPGLEATLLDRLRNAVEGSYTQRLFRDPSLLRKKLLEESQELVEAEEPDHIAAECADVMYFAMVRLIAGGATLADVERHLDHRALKVSRRPGNAKAYRTEAAEAVLAAAKAKK